MFELVIERSSLTGNEHTNLQCSINLIKQYNYGTYIMKVVYLSLYVVKKKKRKQKVRILTMVKRGGTIVRRFDMKLISRCCIRKETNHLLANVLH